MVAIAAAVVVAAAVPVLTGAHRRPMGAPVRVRADSAIARSRRLLADIDAVALRSTTLGPVRRAAAALVSAIERATDESAQATAVDGLREVRDDVRAPHPDPVALVARSAALTAALVGDHPQTGSGHQGRSPREP
ncbi:hypothetical protein [Actinokineospora xionganensis]|uniref:Uncharacterized protein n=1 Tax=Actinokineospora xionganensis TaxID=2684470 RepID=A0ABR7L9P4_9PSEU|nr:hypothetical protein [Actinokineospora xionganensis]MBC6449425.1 hypothetical protein [Actinokineospora xionganensis]